MLFQFVCLPDKRVIGIIEATWNGKVPCKGKLLKAHKIINIAFKSYICPESHKEERAYN